MTEQKTVSTYYEMEQARREGWTIEGYILRKEDSQKEKLDWDSLDWHTKQGKDSFSWVYLTDSSGKPYPALDIFIQALRAEGDIWEGRLQYLLSKDGRYLNRIKHNGDSVQN